MSASAPLRQPIATIPAGATGLSDAVYVGNGEIVGYVIGANWQAADISVQASPDGATFGEVLDDNGTALALKAAANEYHFMRSRLVIGPWIKIRSGASGAAVNQTSGATVTVLVRKFPETNVQP